ncbi:MAG TPA: SH3 domain-containing protein, partial [Phototrophicaceae bacterium]|nr:SH3 domain-containing protein [Phototrophicaceae bacterium]
DNFSIRWTGAQDFPAQGTYRFFIQRDEDAEVVIDGVTIIPFQGGIGSSNYTVDVSVPAGSHVITVSYKEFTGNAYVNFYWQAITTGTAGPTFTPTRTSLPPIPPGALTATVIRASVLNIRDAPSLGGGRLGRVFRGETYAIVGRDESARWFLLQLGGYQGWAWGYYLFINGNEFNAPIRSPFGTIGVPAGVTDTGVVAQALSTMRLRAQPNVAATQTGRITWGGFLPVIGRTADGYWYQVVWKGTVGWVYSPYLKLMQGDINAVPIK